MSTDNPPKQMYDFNRITPSMQIHNHDVNNYLEQLLNRVDKQLAVRVGKDKPTKIYLKLMSIDTKLVWYLSFKSYEDTHENDRNRLYLTNDMVKMLFQNGKVDEYIKLPVVLRPSVKFLHHYFDFDGNRKDTIIKYAERLVPLENSFMNNIKLPPGPFASKPGDLIKFISCYNTHF